MNTASRWLLVLGLFTVVSGGFGGVSSPLGASVAEAQDVQITGPLAGAPAVRKMRVFRAGRVQLQPTPVGLTLQDEFSRTWFAGLQLGYHFTDWIGIAGFFNYAALNWDTGLTDQVVSRGQTTERNQLSLPAKKGFTDQIGRMKFMTGAQITFIPLRGKLALFQALFVDTDFYIFGGVAATQVEERKDVTGAIAALCSEGARNPMSLNACKSTQNGRQTRLALAPTFGVGLSLYMTDYMALTLEYRAFPFKWNTSGTDEGGTDENRKKDTNGEFPDKQINDSDRTFQFNQMFSLGLAFYLPFQGEVTK